MKLDNFITFKYRSADGEETVRTITNFRYNDEYFHGYCELRKEVKTFRRDRIIETIESHFVGNELEESLDIRKESFFKRQKNKTEVCFTGFKSQRKKELVSIAKDNNLLVRSDSTNDLDLLVCGENAGPQKIEKARKNGAEIISETEFLDLIKFGEIPLAS